MRIKLYVFISSARPNVAAFTADPAGGNLPDGYGEWEPGDSTLLSRAGQANWGELTRREGYVLILTGEIRPFIGDCAV
jgi:hypothetical protein